jgi:hypothetical protein
MSIEILIALAHIIGSILAVLVLGLIIMLIAAWEASRNRKRALEEASIRLGVSVEELDNEELTPKVLQLSSERFSSELLRNRISDLCGIVRTLWGWLGSLMQIVVLIGAVWYTVTDSLDTAVYAWFIVGIGIFFWVASVIFSLLCHLLTGRYPGEAKQARKAMAQLREIRRTADA